MQGILIRRVAAQYLQRTADSRSQSLRDAVDSASVTDTPEAWEKVRYEAGSDFPQQLADEVREAVKKALREAVR